MIYAVFVPFFSLWAECGRKYPGVIGESGTKAQAGNLPFPLGGCTDLVQISPSFAEGAYSGDIGHNVMKGTYRNFVGIFWPPLIKGTFCPNICSSIYGKKQRKKV